jgi:hypothetical protein
VQQYKGASSVLPSGFTSFLYDFEQVTSTRQVPAVGFKAFRNRQVAITYLVFKSPAKNTPHCEVCRRHPFPPTGRTDFSPLGRSETHWDFFCCICNIFLFLFGNPTSGTQGRPPRTTNSTSFKGVLWAWTMQHFLKLIYTLTYMNSWVYLISLLIQSLVYTALLESGVLLCFKPPAKGYGAVPVF